MKNCLKRFAEFYISNFTPKLAECLHTKKYDLTKFKRDCLAGLTVAVISIPLAMALAIASGVGPDQGLYTAIIAGFFIALLGGSRYQIGGPTGAFVIVIFNVMQQYGYSGLALCMLIAGTVLILAGYMKLGTYIKYIPYPVITGFTAGIGLLLISTQVKDLLGLTIENLPADFLPKWGAYFANFGSISLNSVFIAFISFAIIFAVHFYKSKLPAYLLAVATTTLIVALCHLNIDTIGNKFGGIPFFLPAPKFPDLDMGMLFKVLPSGLTIAFLAGVESLLSATVVDGMSGDNHNSNAELIGEGVANIMSVFFMGVPATGAIARTAANYKANAYSPISGIMQSVFLLLFMLLFAPIAKYIPLACLSAVLMIIGYNMLGFDKMYKLVKGPIGDRYTLVVTLLLTVLVDLNTAISVGFIMASIIFMHRMSREMEIETDDPVLVEKKYGGRDFSEILHHRGVVSMRISGPLFFGGVSNISKFLKNLDEMPKVLILRMGYVPMVDASGAHIITEFIKKQHDKGIKVIFSNIKKQPRRVLHEAFLRDGLNYHTISMASTFDNALKMARRYLRNMDETEGKE